MTDVLGKNSFSHKTVLLEETVGALGDITGRSVIDCTLGGGGHTELLLRRVGPQGKVIAFDKDQDALGNARERFKHELAIGHLVMVDGSFSTLMDSIQKIGLVGKIDGVIADIGVSSHQIDSNMRGFSFSTDGPLDMRMNPREGESASEFLAEASEQEIAKVLWEFGEEQKSRQIAKLIIRQRSSKPLTRTLELADLIANARLWKERSKKHPATKSFQALRIYVNDELGELRILLRDGFEVLSPGGVLAVISFHSLEDRLVKEAFNDLCGKSKRAALPRDLPLTAAEIERLVEQRGQIIGKFPLEPSQGEVDLNPRSRSAKLRAIKKLPF